MFCAIIVFLLALQTIILCIFVLQSMRQRRLCSQRAGATTGKHMTDVDVIIAAREGITTIQQCVDSVYGSGFTNIILCLDGADDETESALRCAYPEMTILSNKKPVGKILSQMKCLTLSEKPDVLVLDADISLIATEVASFVDCYFWGGMDFLCPYSVGVSGNMNSILFGIAECDRYMRQRIVRAGRDAYGVSNLSGYCMLANKAKYLQIIDCDAIQDDVKASMNMLQKGYKVATYHRAVCAEMERTSFIPFLLQKTRWTAGNILLVRSYPKLFRKVDPVKAVAFSASFLLWYWAWWIDFCAMLASVFCPSISCMLLVEYAIKYIGLFCVSETARFRFFSGLYVLFWPFFSFLCLVLSPYYLFGTIAEQKTRRAYESI